MDGGPASPPPIESAPAAALLRPRSVPTQEQVGAPRLVALVGEVRREQRVDVAARLERRPVQPQPRLLERLAALPVVARLAGGDEVLPGVAAAAMARDDVVERQVVRLAAAVLAGVPVAGEDLAPRQLDPRPRPLDLVLEPDDARARGTPSAASGSPGGRTRSLRPSRRTRAGRLAAGCRRSAARSSGSARARRRPWWPEDSRFTAACPERRALASARVGLSRARPVVPAAGLADLRRERPAERSGDEPGGLEHACRARRRARSPTRRAGTRGPRWRGCRRRPARTGSRRCRPSTASKQRTPGGESGDDVGQRRAARVVEVEGDLLERDPGVDGQRRSARRPGRARRRRSCRRSRPRRRRARGDGRRTSTAAPGRRGPVYGQPNAVDT